jgi:trehalose 6-phosphate synthase
MLADLGLGGLKIGLGVDRLDYTKGIPERLLAVERLFELHPEWLGRFTFLQIGVPSRTNLEDYRQVVERSSSAATRSIGALAHRHGSQ